MPELKVVSDFQPTGDQPQAIEQLAKGVEEGKRHQILLGVTGSGKTFTMAHVIQQTQRPALILAHNKTLAAQLYQEFKEFFPNNAVEYFVSYYDYYQPEAYIARSDVYIEKTADVNEEIDKLRHAATSALMLRRDVVIIASVSCIYGLGSPEDYGKVSVQFQKGDIIRRDRIIRHLVDIQYNRNDMVLARGNFRVRGDTLEIYPVGEDIAYRIELFGDEIDRITEIDPLTGEILVNHTGITIHPAKHFITPEEKLREAIVDIEREMEERVIELEEQGKILEAARLKQRTTYDLEMLREAGYCSGVENYSRHLARRAPGDQPWTLLDYFPDDYLIFIDESHISLPQVRGMYGGDRSRKMTLIDYGFRLPSAADNRPLTFDEFERHIRQAVYVSATPGPYEYEHTDKADIAEQIIRPTGLVDPIVDVRPTKGQIDDLLGEIQERVRKNQRVLVTTLTKRMAEELADYLIEMGVKTHYLHSEIVTLERVEILRDLRLGIYDVVVGINLLREGLDLPEVSLVIVLDADKEGFLRSDSSLIQIIGRAARHVEGRVIMYADNITNSMRRAFDETNRRRSIQVAHNEKYHIEPAGIKKAIKDLTDRVRAVAEARGEYIVDGEDSVAGSALPSALPKDEIMRLVIDIESQMRAASKALEFEKAAQLRDQVIELRRIMQEHRLEEPAPEPKKNVLERNIPTAQPRKKPSRT